MTRNTGKYSILFAVTATQFAVPFMLSSVGVALPSIGDHFQAGAVALSLFESIYIGATAMLLLPFGRLGDMIGHGPVFRVGQIIFCLATLALSMAWNTQSFIAIRLFQGLGGAMTLATGLAILTHTFPREERGRAMGISVTGVYLGISAGPYLGGLLTTAFGWRSVFWAGIPPLLLALVLSWRALPLRPKHTEGERFDLPGALLSSLAIGLSVGGSAGFAHTLGKISVVAGLACLAGFVLWELRTSQPLMDLRLFLRNQAFALGNIMQFLIYASSFGVTFLMSLYLQSGLGMSAHRAGTLLVTQPLIQAALSPLAGRLADRYGSTLFTTAGMVVVTATLALVAGFDAHTGIPLFLTGLSLMGLGISLFSAPNMSSIMSSVEPRHYGVASATTGCMRTTGMTASLILVSLAMAHYLGHKPVSAATFDAYLQAMHATIWVFSGVCGATTLAALVLGSLVRRRRGGQSA